MTIIEIVRVEIEPSELATDLEKHRCVLRRMLTAAARDYIAYLMEDSTGPELLDAEVANRHWQVVEHFARGVALVSKMFTVETSGISGC